MRKTDKKIENKLRKVLTEVCDFTLDNVEGYQWISHQVNYDAFPESLQVTCAFNSQSAVDSIKASKQGLALKELIKQKLASIDIQLKNVDKQISYKVV